MNDRNSSRNLRIGALVGGSLLILMIFIFFIGSEQRIFSRRNDYRVELENVSGLSQGNPVRLSGVNVGFVSDITLPRDPKQERVKIRISVERRYAERIRTDSRARLKRLGLLAGESFIDVSPGSPDQPLLPPGSLIPSAKQTNVDELVASGEEVAENMVEISHSLKNILGRVDRGEGLLGELTQPTETRQRITETLLVTLNKTNAMLKQVESGRGMVGKLVYDEQYADQLAGSLRSSVRSIELITENVRTSFETNRGILPALLNDPQGRERVTELVDNLQLTASRIATFSGSLETGRGLVPRLMNDEVYAEETLREFSGLTRQLSEVAAKLNRGEGTAGKLIADPSVYESINDILIGINESRMLRWLIRNRQAAGIQSRAGAAAAATPEPMASPVPEPDPISTEMAIEEAEAIVEEAPLVSPAPSPTP
jgi:phospholipid/cholesterol/gamma-HCH transport system substrate-binding protein